MSINKKIEKWLKWYFFLRKKRFVISLGNKLQARFYEEIESHKGNLKYESNNLELYNLYVLAQNAQKTKGVMAEVGVYYGGTARIISFARKDNRKLVLFDTFEGIPEIEDIDKENYKIGDFAAPLEQVKKNLEDCLNIEFCEGVFPGSAGNYINEKFSFVHLDVDTFKSTKGCLDFFYPKMEKGGVIVSHDYKVVQGVTKAFDDFFSDKPEPVIEISTTQCAITKI